MKGVAPFSEPVDGAKPAPSSDPIKLLMYALQTSPSTVHLIDFALAVGDVAFPEEGDEVNRGKAQLLVNVPAAVALNLTGPPELQDAYVLIHIERSVVDAMDEPRLNLILPPGMRRSF